MADINRLLACYPAGNWADPEQALRSYLLVVEDYPADDVEEAITTLIKGVAPGVNASFLPVPAVVGAECRRQLHLRLDRENREKKLRPHLPPPDVVHTPEERARVAELVAGVVSNLAADAEIQDAARRRNGQLARTNDRFYPDMRDEALAQRLANRQGYSLGDIDP